MVIPWEGQKSGMCAQPGKVDSIDGNAFDMISARRFVLCIGLVCR